MNVRDSPPEVMLSLLSPVFSVPGQVDPAPASEPPLDVPELDPDEPCPEVDPALLEADAALPGPDPEPSPEPSPEPELVFCPLVDPEI
jgi:hypothetical protein